MMSRKRPYKRSYENHAVDLVSSDDDMGATDSSSTERAKEVPRLSANWSAKLARFIGYRVLLTMILRNLAYGFLVTKCSAHTPS